MNMTRKNLMDLAVGDLFTLNSDQACAYVCEGIGSMNNLTRVTYSLHNGDTREYTFTKVCLTSVYVHSF